MVDVQSVFKKYGIDPDLSINRTIQDISAKISEASDPLVYSNHIINRLGGKPFLDTNEARVIAKYLIEQAIIHRDNYDPEQATAIAESKMNAMKKNHPYLFVMKETYMEATASTPAKTTRGGDNKKAKALAIFEANRDKKPSDIAKLIQVELGITFANAYYYVSRVFK